VAGAALFGSAWIIPSFAVSVLAFTPTDAGLLLLPSGAVFVAALLLAAFLMQARRLPPIATAPLGILLTIVAMWMLSGSTHESGAGDMMAALLVRGLGLGFLFLSITLVAFGGLGRAALATGIGLFNTGRQLGGLMGVAALQTMINHDTAANQAALAAHVTAGAPAVSERLAATTSLLMARGMDAVAAGRAATSLLGRAVAGQSTVIAFETAFNSLALLLVFAAPVVVAVKIGLARSAKARARRREVQGATTLVTASTLQTRTSGRRRLILKAVACLGLPAMLLGGCVVGPDYPLTGVREAWIAPVDTSQLNDPMLTELGL
jgi:MFS transporter, DHA2 family, multidrug resistance protein